MKKQFRMSLLLAALAWVLVPLSAAACDCGYAGAPCKAFEKTPTVFVGRVVKISTIDLKTASGDDYKDRLVSFEVERNYRGLTTKTAEVLSGWNSDCGYRFQEGVRYLVYAYPHSPTAKLTTSICTRTRPLLEASEDLEYLEKKDDPSQGAGIEGMIEELDSKGQSVGSLEGIRVLVEGHADRQTAVTQKDGRFRMWGLSPGRYRVTPLLPKSFWPVSQSVTLKRNSCTELGFLATPRVRGGRPGLRKEGRWHQVFEGSLVTVEVDRTLYERRKDEDCFIAFGITNATTHPVGVDLRRFWNVIYPNSWGSSKTPAPELVDEERWIREPISEEDKKRLIQDYSNHRLTTIMPHRSITYFRGFTFGRSIRKEIDSAANPYLIVGLDGVLETTDGQTTEEVIFPMNDAGAERARWVAVRMPAVWETVPQDSLVVEEHP